MIALLAILVATRLTGSHLHLCFDGGEPPVSVHTLEVEGHHDDGVQHEDRDLDLPGFTLAKYKASPGGDWFVAPAVMSWIAPARAVDATSGVEFRFFPEDPARLKPPTRGPPASLPT
jgi:hypothetical protein